jgi:hypothetical protein
MAEDESPVVEAPDEDDLSPDEHRQLDAEGRLRRYSVDSLNAKVRDVFSALLGPEVTEAFFSDQRADGFHAAVDAAFPDTDPALRNDIAFHLSDWRADAARLITVVAAPALFSPLEVRAAVVTFLVHAPNHVAAAARLGGHPIRDVFSVGPLVGADDEDTLTILT